MILGAVGACAGGFPRHLVHGMIRHETGHGLHGTQGGTEVQQRLIDKRSLPVLVVAAVLSSGIATVLLPLESTIDFVLLAVITAVGTFTAARLHTAYLRSKDRKG